MIIRPATMQDFDAIYVLAAEQCARYVRIRMDRGRLRDTIRSAISAKQHCALVAVEGREIVGALGAFATANMWAQKQTCAIMLWVSKVAPAGVRLLRRFKVWLKPRRGIRVAGFAPDLDCHWTVWDIVEKLGFKKQGGCYLLYN